MTKRQKVLEECLLSPSSIGDWSKSDAKKEIDLGRSHSSEWDSDDVAPFPMYEQAKKNAKNKKDDEELENWEDFDKNLRSAMPSQNRASQFRAASATSRSPLNAPQALSGALFSSKRSEAKGKRTKIKSVPLPVDEPLKEPSQPLKIGSNVMGRF